MSQFFTHDQGVVFAKIGLFQSEVGGLELHASPCLMLASQLDEMLVLTSRLEANIRKLKLSMRGPKTP